jgi:undecaprenyl pyrophosphate phosphatase UppP
MILRFGRPDSKNDSFWRLNAKTFALLIPAVVLGHYIDKFIEKSKLKLHLAIFAQIMLNIVLIYAIHKVMYSYANEFQMTLPGMFFSALFFGMQTNFLNNLKIALS